MASGGTGPSPRSPIDPHRDIERGAVCQTVSPGPRSPPTVPALPAVRRSAPERSLPRQECDGAASSPAFPARHRQRWSARRARGRWYPPPPAHQPHRVGHPALRLVMSGGGIEPASAAVFVGEAGVEQWLGQPTDDVPDSRLAAEQGVGCQRLRTSVALRLSCGYICATAMP